MSIWEGRKKPIDYEADMLQPGAGMQTTQAEISKLADSRTLHSRCLAAESRINRLETVLQQLLLLNEIRAEDVPEKVIPAHVRLVPIKAEKKT